MGGNQQSWRATAVDSCFALIKTHQCNRIVGSCYTRDLVCQNILGVLPYKRLIGMCRWMGSHFNDLIDYIMGSLFSIVLLE